MNDDNTTKRPTPQPIFDGLPRWEQLRIMRRVDRRHGPEIVWGWRNIAKVACVDPKTAMKAADGRLWADSDKPCILRVYYRSVPRKPGRLLVLAYLSDVLDFRRTYFGLPAADVFLAPKGTADAGQLPVRKSFLAEMDTSNP